MKREREPGPRHPFPVTPPPPSTVCRLGGLQQQPAADAAEGWIDLQGGSASVSVSPVRLSVGESGRGGGPEGEPQPPRHYINPSAFRSNSSTSIAGRPLWGADVATRADRCSYIPCVDAAFVSSEGVERSIYQALAFLSESRSNLLAEPSASWPGWVCCGRRGGPT